MSAKLVKRVGRLISELQRRYLLISSVTLKIISQSYAIGDLPCLSSVSSLPYHVPVAFMRSHSFALPMSPSFSHSISPGAYAPLLCNNIHTCTHKHTHTHTGEAAIFLLSEQKIRQRRSAADPRRESRNRASGFSVSARETASLRFRRDREASGRYLSGFRSPVDESWSPPPPPRGFLRLMERGRTI